ncbi:threonine synthase, partial [Deinococcus sp. HMF7604]|nr:threonine synthase [Deinococcus betulae]
MNKQFRRLINPHTTDGVLVGQAWQRPGVPMICLETALPTKFRDTIHEAVNRTPDRPARFDGIEQAPKRFQVILNDMHALKT